MRNFVQILSVYTTGVIKYIIAHSKQTRKKSETITKEFVFITFFIPSLSVFFLTAMIILKTFNIGFAKFEQFRIMLALTETIFGAYVGIVMSSLFEIEQPDEKTKPSKKPGQ